MKKCWTFFFFFFYQIKKAFSRAKAFRRAKIHIKQLRHAKPSHVKKSVNVKSVFVTLMDICICRFRTSHFMTTRFVK